MNKAMLALLVMVFSIDGADARTWDVRKDGTGDYTVIQDAVDHAAAGEYQAGYTPTEGVTAHGVGYQMLDTPMYYFVSGDGQQWFKVASGCRIMIEPILAPRDLTVVALSEAPSEPQPVPLPKALALNAYPNPFNPSIKLELSLPVAGTVEVKVYDIRGGQVRRLHTGNEPAGVLTLTWDGRDNGGRRVSSGIYWARVVTAVGTLNRRMVMIK